MFTEERPSFEGKHYRIHEALDSPRPIQAGGPPILVGGGGEQRTLRIAAKFADLTHWFSLGLETLRHKDELLIRYCDEIGRDPSTIERTMGAPVIVVGSDAEAKAFLGMMPPERRPYIVAGTPEQVVDDLDVHRGRVHRVHVQQRDLPDAGTDREGRRAPRDGPTGRSALASCETTATPSPDLGLDAAVIQPYGCINATAFNADQSSPPLPMPPGATSSCARWAAAKGSPSWPGTTP